MSKGDFDDIHSRLQALLPAGWFGDKSPVLEAVLSSCARSLTWCYSLYAYARLQTRIATASDSWLDIAARDFFGTRLIRDEGMLDNELRRKISKSLFCERGTRQAIIITIKELTGLEPTIIEPLRPADTGGYGIPATGYGMAGRYGSRSIPFQAFVIAHRSVKNDTTDDSSHNEAPVICSHSVTENNDVMMSSGKATDAQIYAAIAAVKMQGTIVWVRVQ
ncbi:hypothetical protein [Pantoea agglomerans]|uniref:hypothetical protein n=1 Tax=Enterobacter agglomerans TaxID=549 RepID=UPI003015B751